MSEQWDEKNDRSRNMRLMLSRAGIELDETRPKPTPSRPREVQVSTADRAEIREYLEQLGCPEWAIESCPSLEYARTYRGTREVQRR